MSTEWEDIQRRFGNLPPAEMVIAEDALGDLVDETAELFDASHNRFDRMEEADAFGLEDNLPQEDERVFEEYRRRRLQQLQSEARPAFGSVRSLDSREAFTAEVTNESQSVWVVVLLYRDRQRESDILQEALVRLARKFGHVKFVRIVATVCIPGYPATNTPTLLVYRNGQTVKQFVGLAPFGGMRLTPDGKWVTIILNCPMMLRTNADVEWELASLGAVQTDLDENPHITVTERVFVNILRK